MLKADIGSEVAKTKVGVSVISEDSARNLASQLKKMSSPLCIQAIQLLVKGVVWFIEQFIVDTLDTSKCALGQLSLDQINKGKRLYY